MKRVFETAECGRTKRTLKP